MKLGIVGLPNVGKSTLFNAITNAGAESANYPFCTIEPNVGVVAVPDERLDFLRDMYNPYSYALVPYIMAEHPELRARDALRESKIMMKGYKWKLFCLEFSFFGWSLLISFGFVFLMATSILTGNLAGLSLGVILLLVGLLILNPYIEASRAAFYREISEQRYSNPQPEAQWREIPEEPAGEETNDYHNDIF